MASDPDDHEGLPVVSVIVPVYRAEKYLDECLVSLVSQTHTALDIILVDDESPDASLTMCEEWARRDPRVRVITAAHGGAAVARNRGLDVMTGAFVTFVDADDVLDPSHVAHLLEVASSTGADVVTSNLAQFHTGAEPQFRACTGVMVTTPTEALTTIVSKGVGFASCGKLATRAAFEGLRFRPGTAFEDLEILPRLFSKVGWVAKSDGVTYGYRRYAESTEGGHQRLLKTALLDVLTANCSRAEDQYGAAAPARAAQLVVGYALHAARILEGAAGPGVAREPDFDAAYRTFMARWLTVLLRSQDIASLYKAALVVSRFSPGMFVRGIRVARQLKSRFAPGLRRASGLHV